MSRHAVPPAPWASGDVIICATGKPTLLPKTLEIVLCMFEVFVVRKWKRKN